MKTFRGQLKKFCHARDMSLSELARRINLTPTWLMMVGTQKGITFNRLDEIINVLNLNKEERRELRLLAKFTIPREPVVINKNFYQAILDTLDNPLPDDLILIQEAYRFVGVKAKVK